MLTILLTVILPGLISVNPYIGANDLPPLYSEFRMPTRKLYAPSPAFILIAFFDSANDAVPLAAALM